MKTTNDEKHKKLHITIHCVTTKIWHSLGK